MQAIRATLSVVALITCSTCVHTQQFLGAPLYWYNKRWFYAWQAQAKEIFTVLLFSLNTFLSPNTVKICGDASVRGQIRRNPNGNIIMDFPARIVVIANHKIYTDWLSLWWSAYTAHQHGRLIIVLKDSLQKLPIFGPGMMFFSWIFLSRKWDTDRARLQRRMSRLADAKALDPMWLLIFPEGTNLSRNTRKASVAWAKKSGRQDFKHLLLPRTRGLQYCLEELGSTVEWVYDCTLAYSGVAPGEYGQDVFPLKALYIDGKKAPLNHLHWRRFAVKDIPAKDTDAFDDWLHERWAEKNELLEHFEQHGYFPADDGHLEAEIGLNSLWEIARLLSSVLAVFVVLAAWWVVRAALRRL